MSEQQKKIVIVGAGGFGREVALAIDDMRKWGYPIECLGFVVDEKYGKPGQIIYDLPILGDLTWLDNNKREVEVICAIGAPEYRFYMITKLQKLGVRFGNVIHPNVIMGKYVDIGPGSIICAGSILTVNIKIGSHVHINLDSTVGHDVIIEDFVTISPGVHISGNVSIGEGAFIGTGANILEKISIGRWSKIGAGSTVIKEVESNTTVVGVPAKEVKRYEPGWHLKIGEK